MTGCVLSGSVQFPVMIWSISSELPEGQPASNSVTFKRWHSNRICVKCMISHTSSIIFQRWWCVNDIVDGMFSSTGVQSVLRFITREMNILPGCTDLHTSRSSIVTVRRVSDCEKRTKRFTDVLYKFQNKHVSNSGCFWWNTSRFKPVMDHLFQISIITSSDKTGSRSTLQTRELDIPDDKSK